MSDLLIRGGCLISDGKRQQSDILIQKGRIERISPSISTPSQARMIKANEQ